MYVRQMRRRMLPTLKDLKRNRHFHCEDGRCESCAYFDITITRRVGLCERQDASKWVNREDKACPAFIPVGSGGDVGRKN
jgi:hypothetical protein